MHMHTSPNPYYNQAPEQGGFAQQQQPANFGGRAPENAAPEGRQYGSFGSSYTPAGFTPQSYNPQGGFEAEQGYAPQGGQGQMGTGPSTPNMAQGNMPQQFGRAVAPAPAPQGAMYGGYNNGNTQTRGGYNRGGYRSNRGGYGYRNKFNRGSYEEQNSGPICQVVRSIGEVGEPSPSNWVCELNVISWNSRPVKYDLREWAPQHTRSGRGITLSLNQLLCLFEVLCREINALQASADFNQWVINDYIPEHLEPFEDMGVMYQQEAQPQPDPAVAAYAIEPAAAEVTTAPQVGIVPDTGLASVAQADPASAFSQGLEHAATELKAQIEATPAKAATKKEAKAAKDTAK